GLEPVDPLRLRRLLLASLGLERDRLRGAGLSPGLQGPRARPPGELGTPGGRRPRSGSLGAAGRTGHATMIGRDGVRARNESAWLLPDDGRRTNHRLRRDMRRFGDDDEVDMVIVGCGAGGGVLVQRLARAGWKVVALDAGPFWDPDADWVSDERGAHHLYWTEPRVIDGADPVPLG